MTAGNGTDVARGIATARQGAPSFPKRFYKAVAVEAAADGYAVTLDGRPARTPARNKLEVPTQALAEAIASEWARIETEVDPRFMPFTRLTNSVIDGVSLMVEQVLAETVRYAESDLLLYRAAEPVELVRRQAAAWDPVLSWCRENMGASLHPVEGVMFVAQPAGSLERFSKGVRRLVGEGPSAPYRLGALNVMTTMTGSVLLAAAVAAHAIAAGQAWAAAHIDEDFQISLWGEDTEARDRRMARWAEMHVASEMFRLTSD